jgi:hypothetical protein
MKGKGEKLAKNAGECNNIPRKKKKREGNIVIL